MVVLCKMHGWEVITCQEPTVLMNSCFCRLTLLCLFYNWRFQLPFM